MKPTLKLLCFGHAVFPGDDIGGTNCDASQFHSVVQSGKATSIRAPVPVEIITDKKSTQA